MRRLSTDDFRETAKRVLAVLWRGMVIAIWTVRELLRTAWAISRGPLIAALQITAALIILFEEWGWRPLSELLGRLAKFAPIAAFERFIAGLPPYGALVALALPASLLLPLKLLAVWLLANEHFLTAALLFVGAKIASTALLARIFILTKPSLMQISWFARAFNWFMPWKDALYAQIRESWAWRYGRIVKMRLEAETRQAWKRLSPYISQVWKRWTGREWPFAGKQRDGVDLSSK